MAVGQSGPNTGNPVQGIRGMNSHKEYAQNLNRRNLFTLNYRLFK